jgi:hypothetical protein
MLQLRSWENKYWVGWNKVIFVSLETIHEMKLDRRKKESGRAETLTERSYISFLFLPFVFNVLKKTKRFSER